MPYRSVQLSYQGYLAIAVGVKNMSQTGIQLVKRTFEVSKLAPLVKNIRLRDDDKADAELVASIKADGLLEDPVVSVLPDGTIGITAGFRRIAALVKLGVQKVSCGVAECKTMADAVYLNLIENLQRKDPHYVEFAKAIGALLKEGEKVKNIAKRLSKDESVIYNYSRLADSPALDFLEAMYLKGDADLPTFYDVTRLLGKKADAANAKARIEKFIADKKSADKALFDDEEPQGPQGPGEGPTTEPTKSKVKIRKKEEVHEERKKLRAIEKFLVTHKGDDAPHYGRVEGWLEALEWVLRHKKVERPESDFWVKLEAGKYQFDETAGTVASDDDDDE